ncbi:MAG: metallopeptidase TldD-related protein [Myxococcota bacterium]
MERGRKQGALGMELLYTHTRGVSVAVARGRAQQDEVAPQETLSVRVWTEGGRAGHRSGAPGEAEALVAGAIADSADAPPDAHAGPVSRQRPVIGGLGILDRRYEQLGEEDRAEVPATAERAVRQVDRRLSASDFWYRDQIRLRRFENSRGVSLEETDSLYEGSGTVTFSADGGSISLRDHIQSRTFASIVSLPFGTTLARRAVDLLQPAAPVEGPVRVLLPPLPVARLFAAIAEHFAASSFGADAAEPLFLQPRPDGAPVVDPRLHLQDDGTLPGSLRSTSFDDRGVCPVPLTLLREGRVDGRFVGPSLAHLHDVRPTGHVTGDRQAPTNLILRSGTRSMNAALADLGARVLIVDDLPDLSGLDPRTGALDVTVHGVVVQGNKPVGAARSVRLRGALLEVLNQVVEVCSDTDRIGHVDAPGIILDGFVAG